MVRWYFSDNRRLAEVEAVVIENNVTDFVLGKAKVSDCADPSTEDGAPCDDGKLCTVGETCTAGSCAAASGCIGAASSTRARSRPS